MRVLRRRTLPLLLGGLGAVELLLPPSAEAHGIVGKADLPIPVWLFSWTAAIVLVVSFVALSTLWRTPQLQDQARRRLLALPAPLEWLACAVGVGLFALVLYAGFAGAQVPNANFNVTFIYVIFWVGMPIASVLFGDVFRAFSPWRTCARVLLGLTGARGGRARTPPLRYPRRLGMWPAVAAIIGFAWLELVYVPVDRERPSTLAALSLGYFLVMLAGMLLFGVEEWSGQADGFGAYFSLLSRLSALVRGEDGVLYARRPLSGVTDLPIRAGTVTFHLRADRHDDVRRLQQRRDLAQQRAEPAESVLRARLRADAGDRADLLARPGAVRAVRQRRLPARNPRRRERRARSTAAVN